MSAGEVIRGNRLRLIAQGASIVIVAALLGWFLQSWEAIQSSLLGRLDQNIPGPLVACAVGGIGVAAAIAIVRDSWNHTVSLLSDKLIVTDGKGTLELPYNQIADVKRIPSYGMGIAVKNLDAWLENQTEAAPQQREISAVLRRTWQVDIGLLEKNLDVGADRLVEMLRERIRGM